MISPNPSEKNKRRKLKKLNFLINEFATSNLSILLKFLFIVGDKITEREKKTQIKVNCILFDSTICFMNCVAAIIFTNTQDWVSKFTKEKKIFISSLIPVSKWREKNN